MSTAGKNLKRVLNLLSSVPMAPEDEVPGGLSEQEIGDAEKRMNITFPDELREWLATSNGPCVGPGGIFGVGTDRSSLDLEKIAPLYDSWKALKWIPVADDGMGNYYVLDTRENTECGCPVYFVDTMLDPDRPEYVVASNLWSFLVFLLEREIGKDEWPFDMEYVLRNDPEIEACEGVKKPWEVD